ncbi:hypothetical protein [Streptomyces sp. NPDC052721]|uniref:hypothetical protein n=1 Tax=Streptomyces sp. NPDC052721 TaxID=3154955 RepID=UPI003437C9A1
MTELMRVPEVAAGAPHVAMGEWLVSEGKGLTAGAPLSPATRPSHQAGHLVP